MTVWAVSQLAAVKTKLVGAAVPSLGSELATGMVTSAVGGVSNVTVKVAVLPDSSVVNPEVGATIILATGGGGVTSILVLVTETSVASLPV